MITLWEDINLRYKPKVDQEEAEAFAQEIFRQMYNAGIKRPTHHSQSGGSLWTPPEHYLNPYYASRF